jgi:hypothetical protein
MTISKWLAIALGIALAVCLVIIGKVAYDEHEALKNANALAATTQAAVNTLVQNMAARDKADSAQQSAAKVAASNVKTTADAAQVIVKYITVPVPASPTAAPVAAPVQVVTKQDFTPQEQAKLPDSPSYAVETQDAATQVAKQLISCTADRKSLDACHADLKDSSSALVAEKAQSATWEAAAKGGTKTQRFLKFLKCAGFAGAGTYAVVAAGQSKWAGIGAVAGVTACQLF